MLTPNQKDPGLTDADKKNLQTNLDELIAIGEKSVFAGIEVAAGFNPAIASALETAASPKVTELLTTIKEQGVDEAAGSAAEMLQTLQNKKNLIQAQLTEKLKGVVGTAAGLANSIVKNQAASANNIATSALTNQAASAQKIAAAAAEQAASANNIANRVASATKGGSGWRRISRRKTIKRSTIKRSTIKRRTKKRRTIKRSTKKRRTKKRRTRNTRKYNT